MNSRPKKLLTLECELKLDAIPQKEGEPRYHFAAIIKKAIFNDLAYEIQDSKQMAEVLAKKIAYSSGIEDNDFLNSVAFTQALPGTLPSNIAVCYFVKFRDKNDPNKNDEEKINRARKLEGTKLTLTLDPQNWKILLPHGTKETPTEEIAELKTNLLNILSKNSDKHDDSENKKIEIVALTNFNKDSNILSLQISKNMNPYKQLLKFATEVTGSEETAIPTNSEGDSMPFSFSIAKLPNLMSVCENILAAQSKAILKYGS